MKTERVEINGSRLPWKLKKDELVNLVEDLPIEICGTANLVLKVSQDWRGILIEPKVGKIKDCLLNQFKKSMQYSEGNITYWHFSYHGFNYRIDISSER